MKRLGCWLLVAAMACGVEGCKPKAAPETAEQEAAQTAGAPVKPVVPLDPATLGDVEGTIHLKGKAPAPVKIDTSMDPACAMGGGGDFTSEQYVVKDGRLANVYLYVKSGPEVAMNAGATNTAPVVLDQKGCRYVPHVIAVMQGGRVEFRNSDLTMHNIHTMPTVAGNAALDVSEGPKSKPVMGQFNKPEIMMPVRCNNHPWMNAFINVSPTPFFAVSDADGHFTIHGLPAGDYVLGAVQEKLGEQTLKVTVPAKGTAKADFTFTMK